MILALKYTNIEASISTTKIGTSNALISEFINEIRRYIKKLK